MSLLDRLVPVAVTAPVASDEKSGEERDRLMVTRTYIPALDGLRTIAVMLVLSIHAHSFFDLQHADLVADPFWRFTFAGDLGVDLFFVISGFLITSILLETKRRDRSVKTFMIRRAIRIFPLYYLYVILLIVLSTTTALFVDAPMPVGAQWLGYLFHMSNFALILMGGPSMEVVILWSLAIEEQFYVIWPFIVRKHDEGELLKLAVGLVVVAPILRVAVGWAATGTDAFYLLPFCRMDPIFVGAAVALIWRHPRGREKLRVASKWLIVPAILGILFLLQETTYHQERKSLWWIAYHYSAAALCFGVIVAKSLDVGRLGHWILENPVITYVGKISYGIYIWHPITGRLFMGAMQDTYPEELSSHVMYVLFALVTVGVASVSWFAFERPLLKLKDRFPYAPADSARHEPSP